MASDTTLRGEVGPISPTALGKFVKLERCGQYLGWRYLAENLLAEDGRFDETLLSPLYSETGTRFEAEQMRALLEQRRVDTVLGSEEDESLEGVHLDQTWEEIKGKGSGSDNPGLETIVDEIRTAHSEPGDYTAVCFQPPLSGMVGGWEVRGKADIIVIRPSRGDDQSSDDVVVDVLEVKSSTDDQTHHRIQAACYSNLIRNLLAEYQPLDSATAFQGRVVTRSNSIVQRGYQNVEQFELVPTEADVRMLLEPGGRVDRILFESDGEFDPDHVARKDPWEMYNRMSRRCAGCDFHDVCYTRGVEQDGIELLGFPEGTQEDLAEEGFQTLEDLGDLIEYDRYVRPYRRASEAVEIVDEDGFRAVRDDIGLKDLERYAIAADVFSQEGARGRPHHRSMIPDSGYNLPSGEHEESPLPDWLITYPDRSLVRVYLFVQEDNIRERIALLGGYVTNHETQERRYVSAITAELPGTEMGEDDTEAKDRVERDLIRRFLQGTEDRDGLVDAIQAVAPDNLDPDFLEHGAETDLPGFVHLYLYSPAQRSALTRAAKRHFDEHDSFEALRTLLGLRTEIGHQEIDQEMVSVLQEEFVSRHLLRFLGFGIVQTVEQFERPDTTDNGPPGYRTWGPRQFDWTHEIEGERVEIPLQHLFGEHLFQNAVGYRQEYRVSFDLDEGTELTDIGSNYRSQFPFAHRHTDDIPLEYVWGAFDELTEDWIDPEAFDDPDKGRSLQQLIRRFRRTGGGDGARIEPRHLRALAEKMAEAVEHIEASIPEWYKSDGVPKRPLPLDRLLTLEFDETELALTAREYLDLEHGARDRQLRRDWRQSIPYRVSEGRSVLFRCTDTPGPGDETNSLTGEIWSPGEDVEQRRHTESSISEGDWVIMTPVDDTSDPPVEVGINRASDIARMPLVHVTRIEDGEITVAAPWNDWDHWPRSYHEFLHGHHRYVPRQEVTHGERYRTIEGEANEVVIDEGASFILDEAHDDVVSYHCARALNHSDANHPLQWLNDLLTGDRDEMGTDFCNGELIEGTPDPQDGVGSFVENLFVEVDTIEYEPNEPQNRFIREVNRHLVVVQGPPGTGKTSYTTSPAVLGRAYAFEQESRQFTGAVSALSHDAVDEVFGQIRAVAEDCRTRRAFEDLKLIRVRPSDLPDDATPYAARDNDQLVEHIAYHHDDGEQRLRELFEEFVLSENPTQFVLFGPPTSIRGAVDKIAPLLVDEDDLDRDEDEDWGASVWELLDIEGGDLFDLTVVDEASMMSLPQLFLVGAFARPDGQLLLAGDHRQMQPIRTYDWEEETRQTIEETIPFLSALDYIRFLKGDIDEMDFIERPSPALDEGLDTTEQEQAVLPIYPLEQSFRLPQPVANLLTELFYHKDGIELGGVHDREPIPEPETDSELIRELARPDEWVTVLVHSGERDERTSDIEAAVAEAVVDSFEVVQPEDEDIERGRISGGVVIPFTAQRDRLQGTLDETVQAQTVEKFQGGERDLILMSMVASDPGYVNQLSEFLLSPYRFNVAASRMKRKLIIVASESVFQTSHPDAERYEEQIAWKRLYERIGALDDSVEPAASGSVRDLDPELDEEAGFEIYHGNLG